MLIWCSADESNARSADQAIGLVSFLKSLAPHERVAWDNRENYLHNYLASKLGVMSEFLSDCKRLRSEWYRWFKEGLQFCDIDQGQLRVAAPNPPHPYDQSRID